MKNILYILIFAGFFISTILSAQIDGDVIICSGSTSYTATTWGKDYQWVVSMNLSLSNKTDNPVTVTANGTGAAWIELKDEKGKTVKLLNIWIGGPIVSSISGPTSTPNGQYARYSANVPTDSNPTNYQWILNPQLNNNLYGASTAYLDIAFYTVYYYQLVVRAENTCGWGPYYVTNLNVY